MGIKEVMNTDSGKILISVIWGLGLAALFRRVCKDNNCIIIKSPPKEDIENKIFGFEDKCYVEGEVDESIISKEDCDLDEFKMVLLDSEKNGTQVEIDSFVNSINSSVLATKSVSHFNSTIAPILFPA